jgi:hypothetical protein
MRSARGSVTINGKFVTGIEKLLTSTHVMQLYTNITGGAKDNRR